MTTATVKRGPQAIWIGRYLASSYVFVLLWALVIGVVAYIILANIPAIFSLTVGDKQITSDGRWFIGPPGVAVAMVAFVVAIVNAGYSRVLIAQGATRRSVAVGNLLASIVGLGFVIAVRAIEALIEYFMPSYVSAETQLGITMGAYEYVFGAGVMALLLVWGSTIAASFQRWFWPVGVLGIVAVVVGIPALIAAVPAVGQALVWVGTPWILTAVVAGIYAWILRGVEVN